jgi:hypothetical protein
MSIGNFFELFFVIAAGIAMPFIVIGSYFNLVPAGERTKPLTIFFLIVSLIYASLYSYFSWKSIQESKSWKRIVEGKKTETEEKNK